MREPTSVGRFGACWWRMGAERRLQCGGDRDDELAVVVRDVALDEMTRLHRDVHLALYVSAHGIGASESAREHDAQVDGRDDSCRAEPIVVVVFFLAKFSILNLKSQRP